MKKGFWCVITLFLISCGGHDAEMDANEEHAQLATNVSIFASKENQKEWVLLADTVNFADLQRATLHNPSLLLKQEGKDSARVSGKTGTFDYTQRLVGIEGNARVESFTERLTITAPSFFYDVNTDRVWSNGKTIVKRGSSSITAKGGIVTDSKFNKIEFKNQTTQLPTSTKELKRNPS